MAQARGIWLHQYLDGWLIRNQTRESCCYQTQALLTLCQKLGLVVNLQKYKLDQKQVFDFVGYQYDLNQGVVQPTLQRWQILNDKIHLLLERQSCSVRQFMSLRGLLTATEKQVPLGRLHMRPIQWRLKRNWHIPESLSKNIPIPTALHPQLKWWLQEDNILLGQPYTFATRASAVYRRLKRRLGRSLRGSYHKRLMVSARKQATHEHVIAQGRVVGPKRVSGPLFGLGCPDSHGQHHYGLLYKQGGQYEVRIPVCSVMEAPFMVQPQEHYTSGATYSRLPKPDCRQTVSSQSGDPDRMVSS